MVIKIGDQRINLKQVVDWYPYDYQNDRRAINFYTAAGKQISTYLADKFTRDLVIEMIDYYIAGSKSTFIDIEEKFKVERWRVKINAFKNSKKMKDRLSTLGNVKKVSTGSYDTRYEEKEAEAEKPIVEEKLPIEDDNFKLPTLPDLPKFD